MVAGVSGQVGELALQLVAEECLAETVHAATLLLPVVVQTVKGKTLSLTAVMKTAVQVRVRYIK